MRELQLLRAVEVLARRYDVQAHHSSQPLWDRAGWPDLALVGTRQTVFRELKSAAGQLTAEQRETGDRLLRAGLDWAVWRPADLENGTIEQQLAALSGKTPWAAA